ncbi:MAG: hypothetical protein HYU64_09265 [Armatimonadetes bacterium]|nr:hypothetical protein [Armatimonadota bacterium]
MRHRVFLLITASLFAILLQGYGGGGGSLGSGSSGEPQVPGSGLSGFTNGAGSVEVRVAFDGAGPDQKVNIEKYNIFIVDTANQKPVTSTLSATPLSPSVKFSDVPIGNRTVIVDALNKEGWATAHGSLQVNVVPGANNPVSVQLAPDPHALQILAEGQNSPGGITVIGNRVYWIEKVAGGSVRSAPIDPTGESPTPLATVKSGPFPDFPHRDLVSYGSQLFWCDYDSGTSKYSINKLDTSTNTLSSNDTNTLLSGRLAANSTAVYAAVSKFVTMGDPVAKRFLISTLAGNGQTFLASWSSAAGIAADDSNVWVLTNFSSGMDRLAKSDSSLTGLFVWLNSIQGTEHRHITVDNTYIYWTEWGGGAGNGRILRANKSDGTGVTTLVSGLTNPRHPRLDRDYGYTQPADRLFWVDSDGLHEIFGVGNPSFTTISGPVKSFWNRRLPI